MIYFVQLDQKGMKQCFVERGENHCPMIQQVWKKEKSEINVLVYKRRLRALLRSVTEILKGTKWTCVGD